MSSILNKPWHEMTILELMINYYYWRAKVVGASGWASAYEAAKCLKHTCYWLNKLGYYTINPYPIKKG